MGSGKSKADSSRLVPKGRNWKTPVSTFFVFLLLSCAGCRQKQDHTLFHVPDTLTLRTGDIVFRTGGGAASRAVTAADTAGAYSHVGMVVWHGGRWCVLHAVPNERATKSERDSVKLEPVGVFFRSDRALKGSVCRLPLAPEDTLRLLEKALALYARHPLFDNSFDDKDPTAFYCSELVWFLYGQALGIDLTQGRRHKLPLFPPLIFCSDIKACPGLEEIFKF